MRKNLSAAENAPVCCVHRQHVYRVSVSLMRGQARARPVFARFHLDEALD